MIRNRAVLSVALAALAVLVIVPVLSAQAPGQVPLDPKKIPQFIERLPDLQLGNRTGIPVIDARNANTTGGRAAYELSMCEFQTSILPPGTLGRGTPAPQTWVWGYRVENGCPTTPVPESYIGPVVVAKRGLQTEVTYHNKLPFADPVLPPTPPDPAASKVLAYAYSTDQTLMWADPLGAAGGAEAEANRCAADAAAGLPPTGDCAFNYFGAIPAAPHLHGGEIPAGVDGGPDAWWTSNNGTGAGLKGHGYYSAGGEGNALDGKATYIYTNTQESAPIWFHDHVLGATRLNVYAGIAGAYLVTDPQLGNPNYPADARLPPVEEIVPIVIQDRMFDTTGQLLFPNLGINLEHPFWVPEFVGDVIVVNGKAWPFLNVEPRQYRFLFLNGSNARAYELFLINKATGAKGPNLYVIGTDQGYLDAAVEINPNVKPNDKLVIMPGERYEVVIDFSANPGATLLLSNTAKTPYPNGAPVSNRTTGRIMQFVVGTTCQGGCPAAANVWQAAANAPVRVDAHIEHFVDLANVTTPAAGVPVMKTRRLTLNEAMGPGGPLEVLVNNTKYRGDVAFTAGVTARTDFSGITTRWNTTYYSERPYEGETEIWEIVNLTADAHPIHPHLVAFQLLNREAFDVKGYDAAYNLAFPGGGKDPFTGAAYPQGVYMPGYGPPLNYNTSGNAACTLSQSETPPAGPLQAACVLGGNPDPTLFLSGVKLPPLPSEWGWKDTVIAYPGQVTRFVVRFAPTELPLTATRANGAAYDFDPGTGHGYVWHCHIIDHEDNEMMRPMSVFANSHTSVPEDRFKLPEVDQLDPEVQPAAP